MLYIYVYQPNDFMIYHISTTEIYDCMSIYTYTIIYISVYSCLMGQLFKKCN